MPEALVIEDVKISPPRLEDIPDREHGVRKKWVDISITVRNTSSKTYYLISSLRQLHYDKDDNTLELGFSEPALLKGEMRRSVPKQRAIQPNKKEVILVSVPLIIQKLSPSSGIGMNIETIDISDVKKVKCDIVYHKTPFYLEPSATPEEMVKQLRARGTIIRKKFDRRMPLEKSQKEEDK